MTDQDLAEHIARDAGELLVRINEQALSRGSPLGRELGELGDTRANDLILARLRSDRPATPCCRRRRSTTRPVSGADRVWIIDPLDGTREFSEGPRRLGGPRRRCGRTAR